MPLLCVDGVIRNPSGQILLVKRRNEPLKNSWWVPGGRVLKGESVDRAFRRKMLEELGIRVRKFLCIGYCEASSVRHLGIESEGGRLHTLSIVLETRFESTNVILDSQSSDWGFFDKLPTRFVIRTFEGKDT